MKSLAIDSSASVLALAVQNGNLFAEAAVEAGMSQSERLIPCADWLLSQLNMGADELDFAVMSGGPGSFTGLRLAFAFLKALRLASGVRIYAVGSLKAHAGKFRDLPLRLISALDAKKKRFYASVFHAGRELIAPSDVHVAEIASWLMEDEHILLTGPAARYLHDELLSINPLFKLSVLPSPHCARALLEEGRFLYEQGIEGIDPFSGPCYVRKSEAEESLKKE